MFENLEILVPSIFLWTAFAALLAGFGKGGFGGTVASLVVPVMTLGMPPLLAISIILPVLCVIDIFTVRAYWGKWDGRAALVLVPAALIGIGIGTLTLNYISSDWLKLVIGLIAVVFSIRNLQQRYLRRGQPVLKPMGPRIGLFWGALGGATSHIAHAGGVPMSVWLLSQKLDRTAFVATSAVFFLFVNFVKLIPYQWNGQFPSDVLVVGFSAMPIALLGVWLGVKLSKHLPDRVFFPVISAALLLTGVKLLIDSGIALFLV